MSELRCLDETGSSYIEILGNEAVNYIYMIFSYVFNIVPAFSRIPRQLPGEIPGIVAPSMLICVVWDFALHEKHGSRLRTARCLRTV